MSGGTLALRAPRGTSPHPPDKAATADRRSTERTADIELAYLGTSAQASTAAESNAGGEPSPNPALASSAAAKRTAYVQYCTLLFTMFLTGWNDGTIGPLLPRIQNYYHASDCPSQITDEFPDSADD